MVIGGALMGKGTKIVGSLLGSIILKPVLDQMKKERKLELKYQNSLRNQASLDVLAQIAEESKPRLWEVHQPFDAIIHQHKLW